jgi:hypothetical protein
VISFASFSTRSARMPPGFMNATTGAVPPLGMVLSSAFWLSAIRLPSTESRPLASGARDRVSLASAGAILPSTLLAIGATSVL